MFFYVVFPLFAVLLARFKQYLTIATIGLANITIAAVAFYFVCRYAHEITCKIRYLICQTMSDYDVLCGNVN